jgi:DNA repair ATPase RecN
MSNVDKTTIKIRAYTDKAEPDVPQSNPAGGLNNAAELAKKSAQLDEMKGKLLEYLKTNEQLSASVKQEQAKTAEMAKKVAVLEARLKELTELETKANKVAELEAKVKDLSDLLGKISGIAAAGKAS